MSCCGADVIVTNSGGGGTTDTYSYLFSTIGISTLGLIQSNVNTGALSNLSQYNSPYNFISTSANYRSINLYNSNANGTSNLASVDVPYGTIVSSNYNYSIFPPVPNDGNGTRLMYQTYNNEDSNAWKTIVFSNVFNATPNIHITPLQTHGGVNIPVISNVSLYEVTYGLYDITTSAYSADGATVTAIGNATDRKVLSNVFTSSNPYPGSYNSNILNFTTPADMDGTYASLVTLNTTIDYYMNPGGEFGFYLMSSNAATGLPFQYSLIANALYPTTTIGQFNAQYQSTIMLMPNTTYYGFVFVAYPGSAIIGFSNLIDINYPTVYQ